MRTKNQQPPSLGYAESFREQAGGEIRMPSGEGMTKTEPQIRAICVIRG
jgi:hypothetical protein